jgi:hypothetical protein
LAIEHEYPDVLENIKFVIVDIYRQHGTLLDYDVEEALDALIADYRAESQQHTARPHRFTERPASVYREVQRVCEWRLGRNSLPVTTGSGPGAELQALPLDVILACLKRLKKSVQRWNSVGGRQGYLQYINQFIP